MSRDTYAPIFSSPLNPSSSSEDGQTKQTRPPPPRANPTRCKRVSSPSQRLMRKKAAEAWKSEALRRQVVEYERQTIEALAAQRSSTQPLVRKPKAPRHLEEEGKPRRKSLTEQLPFLQVLSLGAVMPDKWSRSINPIWIFSPKKTKQKTDADTSNDNK